MNEVIEHKPWLIGLAGVIRNSDGELDWPRIIAALLTAAVVWMVKEVIDLRSQVAVLTRHTITDSDQSSEIARIRAIQETVLQRLTNLENGNSSATSDRFRKQDGDRLEVRLERLEARLREHELAVAGGVKR